MEHFLSVGNIVTFQGCQSFAAAAAIGKHLPFDQEHK
jgi:hypothetical protein